MSDLGHRAKHHRYVLACTVLPRASATPGAVLMSDGRIVTGKIFGSDKFIYDKGTRTFSSVITEVPEVLRTLWQDSLDLGFGIRSRKSGRVVFFILRDVVKDEDGSFLSWHFEVSNPLDQEGLRGLVAVVLKSGL